MKYVTFIQKTLCINSEKYSRKFQSTLKCKKHNKSFTVKYLNETFMSIYIIQLHENMTCMKYHCTIHISKNFTKKLIIRKIQSFSLTVFFCVYFYNFQPNERAIRARQNEKCQKKKILFTPVLRYFLNNSCTTSICSGKIVKW